MSEKKKLLIFGGATEGRELAQIAADLGFETTVSVATPLGAEELEKIPGILVRTGRLDAERMEKLLKMFDCCVDATHPYAVEASRNIKTASECAKTPLCRLLRGENSEKCSGIWVDSTQEAAERLKTTSGNILLTTGAKELPVFTQKLPPERLFPRVLPVVESILACKENKIPTRNIIAMHGPFRQKLNETILEQYQIKYLVTKDGGKAGGFWEKARAAQAVGAELVIIGRPAEKGLDFERTIQWLYGIKRGET